MRRYRSFAVASSSACAAAVAFSRAAAAADADARACTSANTGSLGTGDAPRDAPESEPLPPPPPSSARARPPFFFRFFFPPAASTAGGASGRAGASWIAMARGVGVRESAGVVRAAITFARSRWEAWKRFRARGAWCFSVTASAVAAAAVAASMATTRVAW
jgi:hypothetical protein